MQTREPSLGEEARVRGPSPLTTLAGRRDATVLQCAFHMPACSLSHPGIDSIQRCLGEPFRLDHSLASFWALEEVLQALRGDDAPERTTPFVEQYVLTTLRRCFAMLELETLDDAEGELAVIQPAFQLHVRRDVLRLLRPPRPMPVMVDQQYDFHPVVGWAAAPLYALGSLLCAHPWGEGDVAPVSERFEVGVALRDLLVAEWLGDTTADPAFRSIVAAIAWPPMLLDLRHAPRRLAMLEATCRKAGAEELLRSLARCQSTDASLLAAATLNRMGVEVADVPDARARSRAWKFFGADAGARPDTSSFLASESSVLNALRRAAADYGQERYDQVDETLLPFRDSAPDGRGVRALLLLCHLRRCSTSESVAPAEPSSVREGPATPSTLVQVKSSPDPGASGQRRVAHGAVEELDLLGEGGMGQVFRVRHRAWGMDLARKRPHPNQLGLAVVRQVEREAEAWSRLGLHPNVVTCYYVARDDRGILEIYAEYVEGGSLATWIAEGRLLRDPDPLARMLEIARQVACGLHHAHEHDLIHQDVKPANVLMSRDGTAKVTDFGVSGGRVRRDSTDPGGIQTATLSATWGGMTPAYGSPEQLANCMGRKQSITRKTDIWSLAVLIVEMLVTRITWRLGVDVPKALSDLQRNPVLGSRRIPNDLLQLLGRCLAIDPLGRPGNMAQVADALGEVYEHACGRVAPPLAKATEMRAAGHNNRAVVMLELGRTADARTHLQQALRADPEHPHANYNMGLLRWRTGEIDDLALVSMLEHHTAGLALLPMSAPVHCERGDIDATRHAARLAREHFASDAAMLSSIDDTMASLSPLLQHETGWRCSGPLVHAAISRDGNCVAILSHDRLFVLNETGESVLEVASRGGRRVSLDRRGERVAVVGAEGLTVLDVASREQLLSEDIPVQSSVATEAILLSHDGRMVFCVRDGLFRMVDVSTAKRAYFPSTGNGRMTDIAVSAEGDMFALSSDDTGVRVYGYTRREEHIQTRWLTTLDHDHAVHRVGFASGGSRVVGGCRGEANLPSRVVVHDLGGERLASWSDPGEVLDMGVMAGGHWVVTVTKQGLLRARHLDSGQCFTASVTREEPIALSLSGRDIVLVATRSGDVRLLRLLHDRPRAPARIVRPVDADQAEQRSRRFHAAFNRARRALQEGEFSAASLALREARGVEGYANAAQAVRLARAVGAKQGFGDVRALIPEGQVEVGAVTELACSRDGRIACLADASEHVRFVDTQQRSPLTEGWHQRAVTGVAVSAGGQWAATASADETVRIWRLPGGECASILRTGGDVSSLHVDDAGGLLLLRRGRLERWMPDGTEPLSSLDLKASTRLVSTSKRLVVLLDHEVVSLDETLSVIASRRVDGATCVAMSPEGGAIAAAGREVCTLWEGTTVLMEFRMQRPARSICLASNGEVGVVIDEADQMMAFGRDHARPVPLGLARCAAISSHASRLVLATIDGQLRTTLIDRDLADRGGTRP